MTRRSPTGRVAASGGAGEFVPLEVMARRLDRRPEDLLRLDGDANPYGCSLRVLERLGSVENLNVPGDPLARDVRVPLEEYTGISRERLTVAGALPELLERVLRAVAAPGGTVIVPGPTRELYAAMATRLGLNVVTVPLAHDFTLNREVVLQAAEQHGATAIILGSPNDPTGTIVQATDIVGLLRQTSCTVIVDESLYEFTLRSVAPLGSEFDNLVVLRDLTAWAGLAGLPVSYAITARRLARELGQTAYIGGWPLGASRAGQLALLASLEDADALLSRVKQLRTERGRMFRQLRKLNMLQPYASEGNFLLCVMTRGSATNIRDQLAEHHGILVRSITTPELPNHLRISVGRSEDTDALMTAFVKIAPQTL